MVHCRPFAERCNSCPQRTEVAFKRLAAIAMRFVSEGREIRNQQRGNTAEGRESKAVAHSQDVHFVPGFKHLGSGAAGVPADIDANRWRDSTQQCVPAQEGYGPVA